MSWQQGEKNPKKSSIFPSKALLRCLLGRMAGSERRDGHAARRRGFQFRPNKTLHAGFFLPEKKPLNVAFVWNRSHSTLWGEWPAL